MKKIGFKHSLLLSTIVLVALSVSIVSYVNYDNQKSILLKEINAAQQAYTGEKAKIIKNLLNEKIGSVNQFSQLYTDKPLEGTPDEMIQMTKIFAGSMNLNSATFAFESGDAYWNQTNPAWPNHKFNGDATETVWYQQGRKNSEALMSEPYLGSDKKTYWISISRKIKNGMVSADMRLNFLNKIVKEAAEIPGSAAFILDQNATILASSSSAIESSKKASDYNWFKDIALSVTGQENSIQEYQRNGTEKILFSKQISITGKNWYFGLELDKKAMFTSLNDSKKATIAINIVVTLICTMIAFVVIQTLYRPINALKQTIVGLSQGNGDLTKRLKVENNDDLGQIAQGVNDFTAHLQSIMLQIQAASKNLQSNSHKLKAQSEHNALILKSHVSETEQVVTAIEEMNATALSVANDAENTAQLTQKANQASEQSRLTVTDTQNTVTALVKDVNSASENVQKMSAKTSGINDILGVIGSIAEQTNLLALNAAIEAARAGEQGRGFAVVADEVRNLASRTKDSTKEIEEALINLTKENESVVHAMDNTKKRCEETADRASEVAQSLSTMTQFVSDINQLNNQIATAANEQSSVSQEISRNMSAINDILGELDKNSKAALTEAKLVASINEQLIDIVNQFKLE